MSANQGGAAYNPAVAVAQLTVSLRESADDTDSALHDAQKHYMWIFIVAPFIAGAIAGGAHIMHEDNVVKFNTIADQIERQKKQEAEMRQMLAEQKANYEASVAAGEKENANEPESPQESSKPIDIFNLNKSGGIASSESAARNVNSMIEEEKENAPLLGDDRHQSADFGENARKMSTGTK